MRWGTAAWTGDQRLSPAMVPAMSFALAIGDPNQRTTRVTQVYTAWIKSDPKQAQSYIDREGFPAELRKQLEQLPTP